MLLIVLDAQSSEQKVIYKGTYSDNFVVALNIPPEKPPELLKSPTLASNCIKWARWYLNREEEVWGYPREIQVTQEPRINGVVVTNEGFFGHVAVIQGIVGDTLYLIEANYIPSQVSTRSINIDNVLIRGYYD